ncbi:MAG: tRNA pseudouridine(55) synthase TruB [Clostridiales bacterium]|nr:tRNA pseudouridine(55) synthase TruB [Clostridiales bacterium]
MFNGVINIYKEKGFTSHDVVAKLRGILKQKKIGHTGTLDPDATGVLPVCLGKGTKLCDMLTDKDKTYKAVLILGVSTDTEDITGVVTDSVDMSTLRDKISDDDISNAIMSFVGEYQQIPPMYSALKVNGKKLYQLAREGVVIERAPRNVNILNIKIIEIRYPRVEFEVTCSKGTYIRSLCRDIATKLGCPGCMEELVRTRVSSFDISKSLTLAEVEQIVKESDCSSNNKIENYIIKIDEVFNKYREVVSKEEFDRLLHNGNSISISGAKNADELGDLNSVTKEMFRLYDSKHQFIGIFKLTEDLNLFKPVKMFYS